MSSARPGSEEPPGRDPHVGADVEGPWRDAAHLDVGVGARPGQRKGGDDHDLARSQRAARASRATPAASSIVRSSSRVIALTISESAPARRTIALPGEPEATSVARKPWAMASMATKTPTVPAMPRTATMAEVQRWRTLRTL